MANHSVRWAFNCSKWNPTPPQILLASACVHPEEKERLAKFYFKKDFKSSLVGRLLMRKFIHETTDKKYNDILLVRDDRGKPVLSDPSDYPPLHFNVSHQGDFVVFAGISDEIKIGVDVMKLEYTGGKTLSDFFRVMSRQFTPQEWASVKGAGNERDQLCMFCRHWCLKESYVKAIGVGITMSLQSISFKVNTQRLCKKVMTNDTELFLEGVKLDWEFQETLLDDNHCVAVALSKKGCEATPFKEIDFEELTQGAVPLLPFDEQYCANYFKKPEKP